MQPLYPQLRNNRTVRITALTVVLLLAVLMAVFTFLDMAISDRLYNNESVFGKFFRDFGELPGILIPSFFLSALLVLVISLRASIRHSVLIIAILAVLTAAANFMWLYKIVGYLKLNNGFFWAVILVFIPVVSIAQVFLFKSVSAQTLNKLVYIMLVGALMMLFANACTQALKLIFGRVRYRSLEDNFTYWFVPNGVNGNYSFPSGHTTSSTGILIIILFGKLFDMPKYAKWGLNIFAAAFIAATALSRVILGAHYATDVTFAALHSFIFFGLAIAVADKIYFKFWRKNEAS